MKSCIENILGLDIPSNNKLILIYFKLNGDGCISQVELAKRIGCSKPGVHNSTEQLDKAGLLGVERRLGKQSYYSVLI